ncbi:MAG: hypothetical protein IKJ31_01170 [Bacteroidaceae bacterium]|nr:hypothetical protein [Bacteroidaceae bacterium]
MKKEYIRPISTVLDVTVSNMILDISKPEVTDKPVIPRSNEYRGDWNNIWGE